MQNTSILGSLLCSLVLFAACSDTSQQAACMDPMAASSLDCMQPLACTGTMRDCRNGEADGCETDISADVKNCGACATECPLPAHGSAVCQNGTCGVASCDGAYKDCNNSPADGCEVDTLRDSNNCGTCGTQCASGTNGSGRCVAGKCVLACIAPFLDCNGDPSDGCEVNGNADLGNCGSCKNACPTPANGNPACAAGTCIVSACTAPYLTCQPGPINSCETNTATDKNNCSACGKVCPNTCVCSQSACVQPSSSAVISTAGLSTFTVPNCVTSLTVKAWGGGGGGAGLSGGGGGGGGGAYATSVLAVTPGETLNIIVGGGGGAAVGGCVANTGAGAGGIGGMGLGAGGSGGNAGPVPCDAAGGGGGGGSFVLRATTPLIVAGGGGGGGGFEFNGCMGLCAGGGGGGANGAAGPAYNCGASLPGGAAGASASTNGLSGSQDPNDGPGGGGGGGGLQGGGGGGVDATVGMVCDNYAAGGGGGGTSMGTTVINGSGTTPGNGNDPNLGTAARGGAATTAGTAGLVTLSW